MTVVACGQRLISSSADKTVKVWSMEPLHTLKQPAGQRVLGLASDGGEM